MKNYRVLTILFLIIFLAGGLYHRIQRPNLSDNRIADDNNFVKTVLPEAQSVVKKQGTFPYYIAYSTGAQTDRDLVGFAFISTDIAPEIVGYAGPIKMLIGITPQGKIAKVHILEHSETATYTSRLNIFLDQFISKGINDPFNLGNDIDGISRATITSNAITRAVEKSLKEAGRQILQLETAALTTHKKPFPWEEVVIPLILFTTAITGILSRKRIIRWGALIGGFLYFGIYKATMVSVVQIVNICLLKFPAFSQSPLWYMLIGLTLLSTLGVGMVFCGSLCPFAAVEEFLFNLFHRKKKTREYSLTYTKDHRARYIKYAVLFAALIISVILGNSGAASIEPFLTLFTFNASFLGWVLLILMLLSAAVYFRFWCKYLCPVGACLGLLARFSFYKIKLGENCTQCAACEKICPTRAIRIGKDDTPNIDVPECILCGKCITVCPSEKLKVKENET